MAEYVTRAEENGTIHIAEDVVAAIVADAVKEVEGVGAMSQNVAEQIDDAIAIDLYLMARYGYAIPEVAEQVQSKVSDAVGGMTGIAVKEVNVHVGGISFND